MCASKGKLWSLAVTASCSMLVGGAFAGTTTEYPAVELRGYGRLGGVEQRTDAAYGECSVLMVDCQDVEKAKLVQAKYLSDNVLLPGVTEKNVGKLTLRVVSGQGVLAAGQQGSRVILAAAKDEADLIEAVEKQIGDSGAWTWSAQTRVPKFLDRWDRFAWRFYYRPWETPKGEKLNTYDPITEFDFAKKNHDLGFVFWNEINPLDTAPDIMQEPWWKWAYNAASQRGLPIGMNGSPITPSVLMNHREELAQRMPQYTGTFYRVASPDVGGLGMLSWASKTGRDIMLGVMQKSYEEFNRDPNVISFLEPHGELKHGMQDILMDYGPLADASYREFLKSRYQEPSVLAERWYGRSDAIKTWDDAHVPELASFLGWGPQAIDLTGSWRLGQEETGKIAPADWLAAGFDDSAWPKVLAPGTDRAMYMPKLPAVYRRRVQVDAAWRARNPRVWLYVWDLNGNISNTNEYGKPVIAAVNGIKVGDENVRHPVAHWGAWEVTSALKDGENKIALRLPAGVLGYRVYLSPDAPMQYPYLGKQKNAQWVDFVEWTENNRVDAVRRGMEMIRQIAPDKSITLMAPDAYMAGVKRQAEKYGGTFHNTGYMGAFWADLLPGLMRSSDMPFSLEPGSPAKDLPEFKRMLGYYLTEGVNAVDYFIHVGNVVWDPQIRSYFEENINLIKMIGKYHVPRADVAILYSGRANQLTNWPWGVDPNTDLGSGYWEWNLGESMLREFPRDAITEDDFARGNADKYKVILDSNTSVMDETAVANIEKWVRAGGTFISYVQTGRHTPIEPNAWPICKLTGYRVARIDTYKPDRSPVNSRKLKAVAGQNMLPDGIWSAGGGNPSGLTLVKQAADAKDLARWQDGTVAIGMRQLGKGKIIQVGVRYGFIRDRFPDAETTDLFVRLVASCDVTRVAGKMARRDGKPGNPEIMLRHYVSNNGLYDVWAMSNTRPETVRADLVMNDVGAPEAIDVKNGARVSVASIGGRTVAADLEFAPYDSRMLITPREKIETAPAAWFTLQRGWWKGATKPPSTPLPREESPWYMKDLTNDWSYRPLAANAKVETLAATELTAGTRDRLTVWSTRSDQGSRHLLLQKAFSVPEQYRDGTVRLWLHSFHSSTMIGQGRVFLDGQVIRDFGEQGIAGQVIDSLKPGSRHVLAVEVRSDLTLAGVRGSCWLSYEPKPDKSIDLAGSWIPTKDGLRDDAPVNLPGSCVALMLRRTVEMPREDQDKNVLLDVEATGRVVGVLVNGHHIRRHHHIIGTHMLLNITEYLKFGESNELELVVLEKADKIDVRDVKLNVYDRKKFP